MSFSGASVLSFESRRAAEMAELIRINGGDPFVDRVVTVVFPDLQIATYTGKGDPKGPAMQQKLRRRYFLRGLWLARRGAGRCAVNGVYQRKLHDFSGEGVTGAGAAQHRL